MRCTSCTLKTTVDAGRGGLGVGVGREGSCIFLVEILSEEGTNNPQTLNDWSPQKAAPGRSFKPWYETECSNFDSSFLIISGWQQKKKKNPS